MGKYANKRNKKKNKAKKALVAKGETLPLHRRFQEADMDETEVKIATGFSLRIPEKVYEKMMYWINKASPKEVSGFGHLDFDEETRTFRVRDAILLEQTVTSGSAEIDASALGKAMYDFRNEENALKWHWHSHPTFDVFWSSIDMELIRQLGQQGWILASVFNCKRESRTAFLTSVDILGKPHDIFVDDLPLKVIKTVSLVEMREYDKEFDKKVHDRSYTRPESYNNPTPRLPAVTETKRRLYPASYDAAGYAIVGDDYIYNPMYDNQVLTRKDVYNVIDEMKDAELEELLNIDFNFPNVYSDYLEARAAVNNVSEAEVGNEKH